MSPGPDRAGMPGGWSISRRCPFLGFKSRLHRLSGGTWVVAWHGSGSKPSGPSCIQKFIHNAQQIFKLSWQTYVSLPSIMGNHVSCGAKRRLRKCSLVLSNRKQHTHVLLSQEVALAGPRHKAGTQHQHAPHLYPASCVAADNSSPLHAPAATTVASLELQWKEVDALRERDT